MIELKDVGVNYGDAANPSWAVQNTSFTINDSEFVSVIGTSGCGKSTLLSVIGGLVQPSEGVVTLDGKPITAPGIERGMVFQNYGLFPWYTAQENIEFALKETGMSRRSDRVDRAREMLSEIGLLDFADRYPAQLSGGMKQRVAIARVLSYRPSVLLMDEPFGALDALTRQIMQELLVKIWEHSRLTVLFITHDIPEAVFLSDRVLVMSNRPGHIKAEVTIDLPRPRTPEMHASPEFGSHELELLDHIRTESRLAEHLDVA